MIVMLGLTLLFFLWALLAKPEPTEWICQQCQAKLARKQRTLETILETFGGFYSNNPYFIKVFTLRMVPKAGHYIAYNPN